MIYLSYFLGNIAILRARLKGWPKTDAPFKLGRWGLVVNVIGLLYGGAMLINFAWPRAARSPTRQPNQTGGLLDFHVGFLNGIPILWTVVVVDRPDRGDLLRGRRPEQGVRPGQSRRPGTTRRWWSDLARVTMREPGPAARLTCGRAFGHAGPAGPGRAAAIACRRRQPVRREDYS